MLDCNIINYITFNVINVKCLFKIDVVATCSDAESGITKIEFSKDNGANYVDNGTDATYSFDELTTGTYNIKVRCTNGTGTKVTTVSDSRITTVITVPTYEISPESGWALSKDVTITYPSGYTNEYSLDGGTTWQAYTEPVTMTQEGTIIARVNDGTNYVTGSTQTVTQIYLTTAQNVSFTPDDPDWKVTNVYEALEDLRNN